MPLSAIFTKALRTDRRTDGPTDGRTDIVTYRVACTRLKIKKHNFDTFTSKHYKLLFFGFGTSSRRFLVRPYPNLAISSEKNRNWKKNFFIIFHPLGSYHLAPVARLRGEISKIASMAQKLFTQWVSMPKIEAILQAVWAVGGGGLDWGGSHFLIWRILYSATKRGLVA